MRALDPAAPAPARGARHQALDVVSDLLGLRPARPGDDPATLLGLVGTPDAPRYLVPLGWPAAATASCLAYLRLRATRTRLQRGIVGRLVGGSAAGMVVRHRYAMATGPDSLVGFLSELLGEGPLAVGVGIGSLDAVWKPTLQVFRPDGTPVAYVKVGWNEVTRELVQNEADALAQVAAARPRIVVPGLLARASWHGRPLTAVAPLPPDVRRLPAGLGPSPLPVRDLDGPLAELAPLDGPWWAGIATTITAGTGIDDEVGGALRAAAELVRSRHGGFTTTVGRWHGDWVPWNLARCAGGLAVWDWEYSEAGAPVGLDEAHAAFQLSFVGAGRPAPTAFADAAAAVAATRDVHPAVADLHALAL
ncbi:MAG: hypothetical protein JWM05_3708, partial [Acidimicrobiales bacterium]|nr:hypothetical protein [Acidimicrobiales bacterium]